MPGGQVADALGGCRCPVGRRSPAGYRCPVDCRCRVGHRHDHGSIADAGWPPTPGRLPMPGWPLDPRAIAQTRSGGKRRRAAGARTDSRSTDTTRRPAGKGRRAPARSASHSGPLSRSGAAYRWATREAPASSTAATRTSRHPAARQIHRHHAASRRHGSRLPPPPTAATASPAPSTPGDGRRNPQGECQGDHQESSDQLGVPSLFSWGICTDVSDERITAECMAFTCRGAEHGGPGRTDRCRARPRRRPFAPASPRGSGPCRAA